MTITIVPESATGDGPFRARNGSREATGATVGAALDALTAQLPEADEDTSGTLVLIQRFRPDRFFTAAQRERLATLMQAWRAARDSGASLPPHEQAELEALVQAELVGMAGRAQALLDETPK
jgi:hypothetical protein